MSNGQQQPNAYYLPEPGLQVPPAGYHPPPQQDAPYYQPQQHTPCVTAPPLQATKKVDHKKKKEDDCWTDCWTDCCPDCCLWILYIALCKSD